MTLHLNILIVCYNLKKTIILFHCSETPEILSLNVPMHGYVGRPVELECVSELVTPKQELHWIVTDYFGQAVKVDTAEVEELDGKISSRVSILPSPDSRKLDVICMAHNNVGYVEERKSLDLQCEYSFIVLTLQWLVSIDTFNIDSLMKVLISDLSFEVDGVVDGENITVGSEILLECSVEYLTNIEIFITQEIL